MNRWLMVIGLKQRAGLPRRRAHTGAILAFSPTDGAGRATGDRSCALSRDGEWLSADNRSAVFFADTAALAASARLRRTVVRLARLLAIASVSTKTTRAPGVGT
jgi:hypothetical protein